MAHNCTLRSLKADLKRLVLLTATVLATVPAATAQTPAGYSLCPDQQGTKNRLKAALSRIQSVGTAFRQEKENPLLARPQTAEGLFFFERPDKVRWEYRKPYNSVLILNGKNIRSLENGVEKPLQAGNQRLMAGLSAGIMRTVGTGLLENRDYQHQFWCTSDGTALVRLVPREARIKRYLREIHVYFSKEGDYVIRLDMLEQPEGVTRLFFEEQKLNERLPAETFR